MNFDLSEDQQLLKNGVERFIADRCDFESRRKRLAAQSGTDREMWSQFAEMGWLAILVPEAAGGMGWSMIEAAVILEEFGRGLVTEPYLEGALVAPRLLAGTDAAVADELLGAIASGEELIVPALLEARGRYEFRAPRVEAKSNGGGFTLSGRKILVAGGDAADRYLVTALLDGKLAIFHLTAETAGLSRRSYRLLDGSWAADLDLDDVQLAPDALLASAEGAAELLERVCDEASVGVAALEVGSCEQAVALTAEYLETRKQFGQPLADFQVLQHRMADLFIEAAMAKSSLYGALSTLSGPSEARQAAVSRARARIDRAALEIGNTAIHLHGGMGMTVEYPVGHYYRRMVQLARTFGDREYHLDRYERLCPMEA